VLSGESRELGVAGRGMKSDGHFAGLSHDSDTST
jgi:hypothetical protein